MNYIVSAIILLGYVVAIIVWGGFSVSPYIAAVALVIGHAVHWFRNHKIEGRKLNKKLKIIMLFGYVLLIGTSYMTYEATQSFIKNNPHIHHQETNNENTEQKGPHE